MMTCSSPSSFTSLPAYLSKTERRDRRVRKNTTTLAVSCAESNALGGSTTPRVAIHVPERPRATPSPCGTTLALFLSRTRSSRPIQEDHADGATLERNHVVRLLERTLVHSGAHDEPQRVRDSCSRRIHRRLQRLHDRRGRTQTTVRRAPREAEAVEVEAPMATYGMSPGAARNERPQRVGDAKSLLATARRSFTVSDLDEAVRCAEDLLDLAIWEHDPAALATMSSAIPFLDSIFSARLGPRSGLVRLGAPTDSVKELLSLRALELLSRIT